MTFKNSRRKTPCSLPRVGMGYDIHPFVTGRPLILGGVEIPFEQGLQGHSDADALLHAICDALLGAAALGDIGKHFPDTDERYRGISSLLLLRHVVELLRSLRYRIVNIDATALLERPKIAPYVSIMQERIAAAASIALHDVSVKATTHEKLGTLGRGEGCAAFAVAMLLAPTE